jgi:opacity protein-like surface antigen
MGCVQKMAYGLERSIKCSRDLRVRRSEMPRLPLRVGAFLCLLASVLLLASAGAVSAQVVQAGNQGALKLSAGVIGSGDTFQYGQRKMLGAGAFVDADATSHWGIEAEGRWVEFHQTAQVHAETYSIGGRYHFNFSRWQPYAKGLVGFGIFTYPYNLAQDHDLIVTAGGGVDFHLTHRISLRVVDLEYQDWPTTHFGSMTSLNGSVGLKVRIF